LRRFITLIDALYEGRVRVHVYAESNPLALLNVSPEEKASCVHDEVFAFDRTVSRLLEMQSEEYTTGYYTEWLQRRQLPVVSALMDAVEVEASEQQAGGVAPAETIGKNTKEIECTASIDLVPNFIVDSLTTEVLRAAWDSYCEQHKEVRGVSSAVDAPSIFVKALESYT
ncbi:unnamed protein product, partial [Symbiodinium microadriaticum]